MSNDISVDKNKDSIRLRRKNIVVFDKTLAEGLGLNEAILFEYLMFQYTNQYLGRMIEGKWWIYFSTTALNDVFPFLSRATIHRTLQCLTSKSGNFDLPLLETGNFNNHKYDRTTWYTPTTEGINLYKWALMMGQYETSTSHFKKSYIKLRNAFYKIGIKLDNSRQRYQRKNTS